MDVHVTTLTSATLGFHASAQKMLRSSHMEAALHHKCCDGQTSFLDLVQSEYLRKNQSQISSTCLPHIKNCIIQHTINTR